MATTARSLLVAWTAANLAVIIPFDQLQQEILLESHSYLCM